MVGVVVGVVVGEMACCNGMVQWHGTMAWCNGLGVMGGCGGGCDGGCGGGWGCRCNYWVQWANVITESKGWLG